MQSKTWSSIYRNIENKMEHIREQRGIKSGKGIYRGGDGIFVMKDKLTLEYQRLSKILHHVGCHFCAALDREHHMKAVCAFVFNQRSENVLQD